MLHVSQSLGALTKWIACNRLRARHKTTIQQYEQGQFDCIEPTIGLGDALQAGILNPECLRGNTLLRVAMTQDARVWQAWHDNTVKQLEIYKENCGNNPDLLKTNIRAAYIDNKLMPFEELIDEANRAGCLPFLKWLHALPTPWRPIEWQPMRLLAQHRHVGEWALDTFKNFDQDREDAEKHARFFMDSNTNRFSKTPPSKYFRFSSYSNSPTEQKAIHAYAQRAIDALLPPETWNWRRRWEEIGKDMPLAFYLSKEEDYALRISQFRGAMMTALLHQAPEPIQMVLCALKKARHPKEINDENPDAQFIRHHFFAEHPPKKGVSPILSAAFLLIDSIDPHESVTNFLIEQLLRGPHTPIESFSLNGMDL